jgi:hypothetical protein
MRGYLLVVGLTLEVIQVSLYFIFGRWRARLSGSESSVSPLPTSPLFIPKLQFLLRMSKPTAVAVVTLPVPKHAMTQLEPVERDPIRARPHGKGDLSLVSEPIHMFLILSHTSAVHVARLTIIVVRVRRCRHSLLPVVHRSRGYGRRLVPVPLLQLFVAVRVHAFLPSRTVPGGLDVFTQLELATRG